MGRAVITGIGVFSPLGNDPDVFFNGALQSESRIRPISKFDASKFLVRIGAEIDWSGEVISTSPEAEVGMPTVAKWSVLAARKAIADSGINVNTIDPNNVEIVIGNSISSLDGIEERYLSNGGLGMADAKGVAVVKASPSAGAIQISRDLGIFGETINITTACCSTATAIAHATRLIQCNESTCVIAGGAEESITPLFLGALGNANHLSKRNHDPVHACRPYDRERDGYVLSDAACILVIEEYERAKARNARIYCEITGYGGTSDSTSPFQVAKSEEPSARSLERALKVARLNPEDIDYYCALAISMQFLDIRETRMLKRVFGSHAKRLAISSFKSIMGHPLGASGAIQALTCAMAICRSAVPPTTNLFDPDPECDLDYVSGVARSMKVRNAMLYTLGNGGANAALILSAC
jgi:3-oxoacyl-[acyl-carrier-protein] synthase II